MKLIIQFKQAEVKIAMEDHDKNILVSRENWQNVVRNEVAHSTYYVKCENILRELASKYFDVQMTIIDLGCADGKFTEILSSFCNHATGYEYSLSMLERARQLRSSEKLSFYPIDLEKRDWSLPACQAALCMGVLTYIHEGSQVDYILEKVSNALKTGAGSLFITRESLSKTKTFR